MVNLQFKKENLQYKTRINEHKSKTILPGRIGKVYKEGGHLWDFTDE